MPKLNFLHICEQVLIGFDGKISPINIFTMISTMDFPTRHPKFSILTNISDEPGEHNQVVEIIHPESKEVIASTGGKFEILGSERHNFIANFINLAFPMEGEYGVRVLVDGRVISNENEYFILVKKSNK